MAVVGSVYARFGGDISVSNATIAGNMRVVGAANLNGPAFVRGDIEGTNGKMILSNNNGNESFIDLRAGTSIEVAIVPTFSIIGNATPGQTPSLFISRTNMINYPVPDAIMLTAFPTMLTEVPSTVNVNGLLTTKYVAAIETAGTDPANVPSFNYVGYPIFIFNASAANGYYKVVLKSIPASGAVICTIYDNNVDGSFEQEVRIYASNGTTLIGSQNTTGKQQNQLIAGTYTTGQPQTIRAVRIPLESITPLTIPAAEAAVLHAASEEERGFNKLL